MKMNNNELETKNILLLAGNYPPYDGGRIGSSIRVFTVSEFLAANGFIVHVFIPERYSKDREQPEFHKNIKIHKYFSPFAYYDHSKKIDSFEHKVFKYLLLVVKKILSFIVVNPADIYGNRIFKKIINIIDTYGITNVIASSPPLTVLYFINKIKKKLQKDINCIGDIRDISFLHPSIRKKNSLMRYLQKKYELKKIESLDKCLVVSSGMYKTIIESYNVNRFKNKLVIVENGYDNCADLNPEKQILEFAEKAKVDNRIILIYAGTGIINVGGKKSVTSKSLDSFLDILINDDCLMNKYALIIQGEVKNKDIFFKNQNKTNLMSLLLPAVTNDVMRANLRIADIGININIDDKYSPLMIGGKIYDYCVSGLALLLIFPSNAVSLHDFAEKHNNKPYFADVCDSESIRAVLKEIADNPEDLQRRRFTKEEMRPHSRENQYKKILEVFKY